MSKLFVLVVEDNPDLNALYLDLLEKEGFTAKSFANGKEALKLLEKGLELCVILLDLQMPVMNGRQFMMKHMKQPFRDSPIPVYLL